jgi:hypothetical protein
MLLQWFSFQFPRSRNAAALRPSRVRRGAAALPFGFVAAALVASSPAQADIPAAERQVLVDLYNSAGGASWSNKTNWLSAAGTECIWYGVTCDAGKTHVTALKLNFDNLVGTLPSSLSTLSELTQLNLRQNELSGAIPALTGMTKLTNVDLSSNKFTGTLPSLAGLNSLVEFRVQGGQVAGSTPDLTGLSKLRFFYVNGNKLDGQIGALAGATALEEFSVYNNVLTGSTPDLTGLTALKTFDASVNQLTAFAPMAGLANLDSFTVAYNNLSGPIPSLQGLSKLRSFYVNDNQLSGPIPSLSDLLNIENFYLAHNQIGGQIPSLAGLVKMRALWLHDNQLVGSPPPPPNQTMVAVMCPNPLRNSLDATINQAWDNVVSGSKPWADGCTGSFDVTPTVRDASSGDPITDGSTGAITPDTVQILPRNGAVQFTLTPAPGYHLRTPIGSSCPGDRNGNVFRAGPVTDNCFVDAVFVKDAAPPVDGVCGSDNGKILSGAPTNLCSAGNASVVAGSGPWTWSCAGSDGGATAQCSAQKVAQNWIVTAVVVGNGGTAAPEMQSVADGAVAQVTATPDSGFALKSAVGCGVGAVVMGTTSAPVVVTTAPVTADCTVTFTFAAIPVDGVCGSDNGKTLTAAPTNLCSAGNASVVAGTGPWTWSCSGLHAGTSAQCSAQKATQSWTVTAVVNGSGGAANPATQSVADGAHATVVAVPNPGYALTGATGCGGVTISGNTITTAAVTADCTLTLTFASSAHATTTQFVSVTPSAPRVGEGVSVSVHVGDAALAPTTESHSGAAAAALNAQPAAIPSGTVTVAGGGVSCIVTLDAAGNGQCSLHFPAAGIHQLTATYPGSAVQGHLPSSAVYIVTVSAAPGSSLAQAPLLDHKGLLLLGLLLCGGAVWRRARR